MFSGHGLEIGRGDISPGQELVEAAVGVAVDDAGNDVGQVGVRLDANQLTGLCRPPNYAERLCGQPVVCA
jgi:hypothetical protein